MQFGHEQLNIYRLAIDYVAWSCMLAEELSGVVTVTAVMSRGRNRQRQR